MMDNTIAKRYAQALFALAQERQEVKQVESELLAVQATMTVNADLQMVIYHQLITSEEKKQIIGQLFKNLNQDTLNFIYLLIDKRREKFLETIIDLYHAMCMELEQVVTAEVKTAAPLSAENKEALVNKFSSLTGKKIVLHEEVDEKLIGGLVVTIGDKIFDGSVISQLKALHKSLSKTQI